MATKYFFRLNYGWDILIKHMRNGKCFNYLLCVCDRCNPIRNERFKKDAASCSRVIFQLTQPVWPSSKRGICHQATSWHRNLSVPSLIKSEFSFQVLSDDSLCVGWRKHSFVFILFLHPRRSTTSNPWRSSWPCMCWQVSWVLSWPPPWAVRSVALQSMLAFSTNPNIT